MKKKLLATLLSLAMVLSLLPTWAIAVGNEAEIPGDGGDAKQYATLAAAVADANDGDTITLLTDVTLTEQVVIPEGKSLTLNLSGKTITGEIFNDDGDDWPSVVLNKGTLTVEDSVGTGKIDGGEAIAVYTYGELTIESGEFIGGEAFFPVEGIPFPFWAVLTQGSGSAVIKGGTFVSKSTKANECPVGGNVTVSGGVFSHDLSLVTGISIAMGHKLVANDDGTWTVSEEAATAVAKIGDEEYATLADAVAAAKANGTITLLRDMELEDMTFSKNMTLDLDGHMLTIPAGVTLTVNCSLTIKNSQPTLGGVTNNGDITVNANSLTIITNTLNIYDLPYSYGDAKGGLIAGTAGTLHIKSNAAVKYMADWVGVPSLPNMDALVDNNPNIAIAEVGAIAYLGTAKYLCTKASAAAEAGTGYTASKWSTTAVAAVNGQGYDTFADAAAAANGEPITLLAAAGTYTLAENEILRVALNGKTITVKAVAPRVVAKTAADANGVTTYTAVPATWKFTDAANGNVTYYGESAVSLTTNGTLELLRNATCDRVTVGSSVKKPEVTIDLGGYTLTSSNTSDTYSAITFGGSGTTNTTKITVKHGTLCVPDGDSAFQVRGSGSLVLEDDLTVSTETTGVVIGENGKLTTSANITTEGNKFAIATNGDKTNAAAEINVLGGALESDSVAIYLPAGQLNVSGGTITGTTAVYVKSGTTTISGGTLRGTGAVESYTYNGNGCNATGDALVVDNCGYPGGEPVVNITGGTFESTYAKPVGSYYGNTKSEPVTGFITGGTFSSEPDADYLAVGYEVITLVEGSKYQVCKEITQEGLTVTVDDGEAQEITALEAAAVKAVVADVVAEVTDNTEAPLNKTVTDNTEVTTLKITPQTLAVKNDEAAKAPVVTSITYDVQPMNGEDEVSELETALKFRLPVPAGWETVKVYHEDELKGIYTVLGTGDDCYVELESSTFSSYTLEQVERGEVPTDETLVARVGDNYYTDIAEAISAALDNDEVLVLLAQVDATDVGFTWTTPLRIDVNDQGWYYEGDCPCVDVDAPGTRTVTLAVSKTQVAVGETFTVTPTLSEADTGAIQLKLTYDANKLEFVSAGTNWEKTEDGTVWYFNYSGLTGDELPAVTFKALAGGETVAFSSSRGCYMPEDGSSAFYYELADATSDEVSINSIVVTLPNPVADKVYNGQEQSAGITAALDAGYTVVEDATGTNVGTYSVKLRLANDGNVQKYAWPTDVDGLVIDEDDANVATYPVLTITEATVEVTAPTLKSGLKYNGNAQDLLDTAASATSNVDADSYGTFYYGVTGDAATEPTTGGDTATATAVGTHYVWYKFVPGDNFMADNEGEWQYVDSVEIGKGEIDRNWFTRPVAAEEIPADGAEHPVLASLAEKKEGCPDGITFEYIVTNVGTYTPDNIGDTGIAWQTVSSVDDLKQKDEGTYDIWLKVFDSGDNYIPCYDKVSFTIKHGNYVVFVTDYLGGVSATDSTAAIAPTNLVLVFAQGDLHFTYGNQAMYEVTGMGYTLYNIGTITEPVYALEGTTDQVVVDYSTHVYAYLTSNAKENAESNVKLTTNTKVAATIATTDGGVWDVSGDKKVIVNDAAMVREVMTDGAKSTIVRKNLRADVNRDGKVDVSTDADAIKQYILTH